jgi:putative transposase
VTLLTHKVEMGLNNKQATYCARAAGTSRFAYNWALNEWSKQYEAWKLDKTLPKPNEAALRRQLNAVKKDQYPWMAEVTKCAPQLAIMNLGEAFKNFFAKRAKYPTRKRKGVHDSFQVSNDQFEVNGRAIRLPKLGWVRMHEPLRYSGKLMSATISRVADRWYVAITIDVELSFLPHENQGAVGIDLGVSALAALSTGEKEPGPKAHKALLGRLRRLSRSLSRKKKHSGNWKKAKKQLARLHARIANIRNDATHKLTSGLTQRFELLGIEDLNVRGMMANRKLARSVADTSFFEFRRQLEYKAARRGGFVAVADRFFPSSKLCSTPGCGCIAEAMPLNKRTWTCSGCGTMHDRDINAAVNLKNLALKIWEAAKAASSPASSVGAKVDSSTVACGAGSAGRRSRKTAKTKLPARKQEVSSDLRPA